MKSGAPLSDGIDLGYIIRIHGREFNGFRRKTPSKRLHEFEFHRQEKFLYVCDTLHSSEWWDIRVVDIQEDLEEDHTALCLGGPGAASQEFCGGPIAGGCHLNRKPDDLITTEDVLSSPVPGRWRTPTKAWPGSRSRASDGPHGFFNAELALKSHGLRPFHSSRK